jgi:hypothetical protein
MESPEHVKPIFAYDRLLNQALGLGKCHSPRDRYQLRFPDNGTKKMFYQSLYLRLRSTVSRHPKVCKGWRREKRQPSAKETREDFYVGVV